MDTTPPSSPTSYRKIRVRGSSFGAVFTLYLAPDHLLMVEANGFSERYRRIYFSDIQAAYFTKTVLSIWISVVLSLIVLLFGLIWIQANAIEGVITGAILTGIFGLILAWHLFRGRSCKFFLKTAVREHRIYPVTRIKSALRVMKELLPLVEEAQRTFASPTLPPPSQQPENPIPTATNPVTADVTSPVPPPDNPPPS